MQYCPGVLFPHSWHVTLPLLASLVIPELLKRPNSAVEGLVMCHDADDHLQCLSRCHLNDLVLVVQVFVGCKGWDLSACSYLAGSQGADEVSAARCCLPVWRWCARADSGARSAAGVSSSVRTCSGYAVMWHAVMLTGYGSMLCMQIPHVFVSD